MAEVHSSSSNRPISVANSRFLQMTLRPQGFFALAISPRTPNLGEKQATPLLRMDVTCSGLQSARSGYRALGVFKRSFCKQRH